jgi:hypothetical protein
VDIENRRRLASDVDVLFSDEDSYSSGLEVAIGVDRFWVDTLKELKQSWGCEDVALLHWLFIRL